MGTTVRFDSHLGKRPVILPDRVEAGVSDGKMWVKGPRGTLTKQLPPTVNLEFEGRVVRVNSSATGRDHARLQGLGRALFAAMVKGVAEGYTETIDLVGTGYRCEVMGQTVTMQVGLSHPATFRLPDAVTATVPAESKGTMLVLSSPDKALLGQAVASIRRMRPPEPYGGKGVRRRGEVVRIKEGKKGKTAKGRGK